MEQTDNQEIDQLKPEGSSEVDHGPEYPTMTETRLGQRLARMYNGGRLTAKLLDIVVKREGGQFTSVTLREVLSASYGVHVGAYSYGSLLVPGMADRHTVIGRYVSIGPNVRRFGAAHPMSDPSMHPYWYNPDLGIANRDELERTQCSIGHDSWIGANTTILPKCSRIGIGAVVGAGSVVTDDIPDFSVVAGNPARVVRTRFPKDLVDIIKQFQPWTDEPEVALKKNSELKKIITRYQ